jgi:acyl dehydratase
MRTPIRIDYCSKPSLLAFMAQAFRPSRGFSGDGLLPDIQAHWPGQRSSRRDLADFFELSGLPAGEHLSIIYPHTVSFPMQLAVLSHPLFPVSILNTLQVRNRLIQHAPIAPDAVLDFTVRTGDRRLLEKGVEMDLLVAARANGRTVWEAVNTFYARGRFGVADSAPNASPEVAGMSRTEWPMPEHGRWRYGRLSGDFNPLHLNSWYAHRLGFEHAFAHPQRAIGQCLAHLGAARHAAMTLETWIKGPVFYGAKVVLRADAQADRGVFALHANGDERPAIVGRYQVTDKDST